MRITYKSLLLLGLVVLLIAITGCEYDGPTAVWDQNRPERVSPVINQVDPAEAGPGVNYLTLIGENFSADSGGNKVYVNGVETEVVDYSATSVKIRRPSVTGDTTMLKLATPDGLGVAAYPDYKITPIAEPYGGFIAGESFGALVVDNENTVYVFEKVRRNVFKIAPDGTVTEIAISERAVKDARIAPNGMLILLLGRKNINQMNPVTGEETEWASVSESMTYGDFDANGNLYAGGRRTDLFIIAPDLSNRAAGFYEDDEIFAIRVVDNYVYVALEFRDPDDGVPPIGIWKHEILDAAGNLGPRELVLDWATTGAFAESSILDFEIAASGRIYIGTDNTDPILMLNPDQSQDILYKGIIPTEAAKLYWSPDDVLYMVLSGDETNLLGLEVGEAGIR